MEGIEELTKEEGILYSLYLADGEILGKVRINKLIARLQRDGFPIINRFINQQMGPHDRGIDSDASNLSMGGYITQTQTPLSGYDNPREDYRLTESGILRVEQQILPKILRNPHHKHLKHEFELVKYEYKSLAKSELVAKVHKELCISEDQSRFLIEIETARSDLIKQHDEISINHANYCYSTLTLLGSLDFTIRCLDRIREERFNDPETGKNHILAQAKKLLENISIFWNRYKELQGYCLKAKECLLGGNCPQDGLESVKYALYCIEWNSERYGILNPFGDNFDLADYMTVEEESLFKSCLRPMNTMA